MSDEVLTPPDGRRGPYHLHDRFGREMMGALRRHGSIYLGPATGVDTPFVFSPVAFPSLYYSVDENGKVSAFPNACSHYGYPLIAGDRLDARIRMNPGQSLTCGFHNVSFDPGSGRCTGKGMIRIQNICLLDLEPEPDIRVKNSLVFLLGDDYAYAETCLESGFTLVESIFPGLFSLDGGNKRISGYQYRAKHYPQRADALTGIVNYLDILHVLSIHSDSLGRVCAIDGYRSRANEAAIVQWVPLALSFQSDSLPYAVAFWDELGEDALLRCPETGVLLGAVWVTFRQTGLMLEWYPGVIVVSQCFPGNDPRSSTFHHHFFYDDFASDDLVRAHQKLFEDTGDEDEWYCSGTSEHIFHMIEEGRGNEVFGVACPVFEDYTTAYYRDAATMLSRK